MKKILLSVGVIVVVAAGAIGATIAFYNDTETSTGNIFTAGSIDLKVDHLKQTYNDKDCKTCSVTVLSNTDDMVVEKNGNPYGPSNAVIVSPTAITTSGSNWDANIPGAEWIWPTDPVTQEDVDNNVIYTFEKKFVWFGPLESAVIDFAVAADNSYEVWLNGSMIKADTNENNHAVADTVAAGVVTPKINQGENTLQFKVKNWAQPGAPIVNNPGGLKYKLTMNGNCDQDSAFQNACRLWTEKDLGGGDKFFNFGDIKPADWGTNVISLHVYDNDAYACLIVGDKDDQENGLQDPEIKYGDEEGDGELSNYLNVFTWMDNDADGFYDDNETPLGSGPLSSLSSIMSMDGGNQQSLTATTTKYIGLVWCAGTLETPVARSPFVCDGSGMENDAQSDSFEASLTAYVEQVRNNSGFRCEDVDLNPDDQEENDNGAGEIE